MDKATLEKQEKIDVTIESIIRKINSTIMLFQEHYSKLDNGEVRKEVEQLEKWKDKIVEIEKYYTNEIRPFKDDIALKTTRNEMRNCEIHILETLKTMIITLNMYVQPLSALIDDAKNGRKITQDYNALINEYNQYISNQQKLMKFMEKAKIEEFKELQYAN